MSDRSWSRFWGWFLHVWGHAVGWAVGFCLALAALMMGVGLILLAGTFLGWTWDVFRNGGL